MVATEESRRRKWGLRKKLALQVALLPICVLVVEFGFRAYLFLTGNPYDREATLEETQDVLSPIRQEIMATLSPEDAPQYVEARALADASRRGEEAMVAHPYYGLEKVEMVDAVAEEAHASLRAKDQGNTYDIVIVGGSVAGVFDRLGADRLGELLGADPRFKGKQIRFSGHGRGSFKQPQQVHLVNYLLSLGLEFDALINIDGFNEVALGNKNASEGVHPLYPSAFRWAYVVGSKEVRGRDLDLLMQVHTVGDEARALVENATRWRLFDSAITGLWTLKRLHRVRSRWQLAQERYGEDVIARHENNEVRGPWFDADLDNVMRIAVDNWVECSTNLQAICDERGITYLHVLQPTLHDPGAKPIAPVEEKRGVAPPEWTDAVVAGYPKLRAGGRRLKKDGVSFYDASYVFRDEERPLYSDACHFRREGNLIFADAIAKAFLDELPKKPKKD